jgi:hypothetical protein
VRKWKWVRPAGAVLLAIITAATYVWPLPSDLLPKWGFLIFFAIFCIYMGFYVYSQNERIKESENKKPTIIVEPLPYLDDKWAFLKVTNNGEKAEFWVKISLIATLCDGKSTLMKTLMPCWDGIWRSSNTDRTQIPKGHFDEIGVSEVELVGGEQILKLWGYDSADKSVSIKKQARWQVPKGRQYGPKPEYGIQVSITSDPSLKEGIFVRDYQVTLNTLEEMKTKWKATSYKED